MSEKTRILIVDDEQINRCGLKLLLHESADLQVIGEATNGAEAVDLAGSANPDLILMDVKMPTMDGIEASRRIREAHANIKIIMLSSVNAEQDVLAAILAGANGYCLKESSPERLFIAIKAVQGGDLWLDSAIAGVILSSLQKRPAPAISAAKPEAKPHATDKYAAMSNEDLKLLGMMVEGHSCEELVDLLKVSPGQMREMQNQIMNKIAVIEATKLAELEPVEPAEESDKAMECPTCNNLFVRKLVHCPYDRTRLVPHITDPLIGTTFADRFEVQSLIGNGSGGAVYKVRHKFMNRLLAIKVMHTALMTDLSLLQRFRQEAEAASSLNHPNVVSVLDFGLSQEGYAYMVMDMLDGPSLADLLHKLGHMSIEAAVRIFSQCSDGLDHAHSKGIIHRDFKPSNIILVNDADAKVQAKIVDFGIVKILKQSGKGAANLTIQGEVYGTPSYMSPEQCAGLPLTPASDTYSWGVSLYETLTGTLPFSASSIPELMYMHIKEAPIPLSSFESAFAIPASLSDTVMRCLEKEPKNRFRNLREAKEALLSSVPVGAL